jgi:hypothetical protein
MASELTPSENKFGVDKVREGNKAPPTCFLRLRATRALILFCSRRRARLSASWQRGHHSGGHNIANTSVTTQNRRKAKLFHMCVCTIEHLVF